MNFIQKHARIILPLPLLFIVALKLWQAVHGDTALLYVQAAGFALGALLWHWAGRSVERAKREKPNL